MDGHGSHCTDQMVDYGVAHSPTVHLFIFPPHTTHKLQPLDVGVFGVAQRLYWDRADRRTYEGNPITRSTVISEWMDLRPRFMTDKIILSAWEHTGNYPINPRVFTDDDYAPSYTTSTHTHLPVGYPVDEGMSSETDDNKNFESETPGMQLRKRPAEKTEKQSHRQPREPDSSRQQQTRTDSDNESDDLKETFSRKDLGLPAGFRVHLRQDVYWELARLREVGEAAFDRAERAEAHAHLMAKENRELRKQLHTPKQARSRKLNTQARFLTGTEGLRLRAEAAEREAQESKVAEEKAQKTRQIEELRMKRRETEAPATIWHGAWQTRIKPEIQDLAFALDLSMDGTKAELVDRIQRHLKATPARANDIRFAELYTPVTRGRRRKAKPTTPNPTVEQTGPGQSVANEISGNYEIKRGTRTLSHGLRHPTRGSSIEVEETKTKARR